MNKSGSKKQTTPKKVRTRKPRTQKQAGSLVNPQNMGGIVGGGGFDFQNRYIVSHLPKWLLDPNFSQVFHEGTGDVDILYIKENRHVREHIQIKDHQVSKGELQEVLNSFIKTDQGMPNTYQQFTLACPSLGKELKPLESGINRLRSASLFYQDQKTALDPTETDLRQITNKLGLSVYADFILKKLYFHTDLTDFHEDERACQVFFYDLQHNPTYSKMVLDILKPSYAELLRQIIAHRGKTIDRVTIEKLITDSIKQAKQSEEVASKLVIHNWTFEKFDIDPEYVLDWSSHFERSIRKVPTEEVWSKELLPQLNKLKEEILSTKDTRLIKFRGKCCLSTGLTLGAVFPTNGSWVFEVLQPPQNVIWRSDAQPEVSYKLVEYKIAPSTITLDINADSIAFVVSVTGKAQSEVVRFIEQQQLAVKEVIVIQPPNSLNTISIANNSEAVSFAISARDVLKQALSDYNVRSTHLFFFGPLNLAIFLGQRLTSIGCIQLYEFTDPGYVLSAKLRT